MSTTPLPGPRARIERVDADGHAVAGTCRSRGVTRDDYRTLSGAPMAIRPGDTVLLVIGIEDLTGGALRVG